MPTFEIYCNGAMVESGRITDWANIENWLALYGKEENLEFRFRGKNASLKEMYAYCDRERVKYFSKRKRVRVHHGVSGLPGTYSFKWVMK